MPKALDRLIAHIQQQYEAKGKSPEEAESIAWATVVKRGWAKRSGGHMELTAKGERVLEKEG